MKLLDLPKEQPTPERANHPPLIPQHPALPPSQPGAPGPKKGFQEETRQTVLYGSISNRGRSSVAAEATPLGRYKKKISTAIGSRWYFYTNESAPNIGTVTVSFKVTASGKIIALRVLSGTANSALTDCTLRSIMEAKIPPMPPEVAALLQDGSIDYESFSFTIY
jgi:TonB family protein